jgi:hypothetical protein
MLARDRAELIMAEHAAGKSIREIAEAHGHSITTIRDYVRGRRTPGEPAARDDEFVPYTAYCRRRLADDPHLRTPALLGELSVLGFSGSRATFYRALERHGIQTYPCPDCHPASMSGYSPPAPGRSPEPLPLPKPAAPVAGETLTSFLGRLAAVNRTSPDTLLDILPHWFRVKARWHDDRWQPARLIPLADAAAARLAMISGSTTAAIKAALPAFGGNRGRPLRAAIACRLCTAARGIQQPVPVHLPAYQQLCTRHGIWLPGPGTPQFSVRGCPDILDAEHRARRLLRQCSIEELIYSTVQKPGQAGEQSWKRQAAALIESNPRSAAESSPQEMFLAAAYPDAVAAAHARSKRFREQSSLAETTLTDR